MRHFHRAARRGGLPLAYSQGFNPHPRLVFASPLPVGATGREELGALDLYLPLEPVEVAERLSVSLPEGVRVLEAFSVEPRKGTFGVTFLSTWEVRCLLNGESLCADLAETVGRLLDSDEVLAEARSGRSRNIRSRIRSLSIESFRGREATVLVTLIQEKDESARPQEVVTALEQSVGPLEVVELTRRSLLCPSLDIHERIPERSASAGSSCRTTPGRREVK